MDQLLKQMKLQKFVKLSILKMRKEKLHLYLDMDMTKLKSFCQNLLEELKKRDLMLFGHAIPCMETP